MARPVDTAALIERYYDAFNTADEQSFLALLDEDVEIVVDTATMRGRDAARAYIAGILQTYPGVQAEVVRVVTATEDAVVTEMKLRNPSDGPGTWHLEGTACEVFGVRAGRITSVHSYYQAHPDDRTAVAAVPSRAEAARIAEGHAALQRVAMLVARDVAEDELFAAVNEEVARLVDADAASLLRFEPDETVSLLAAWSPTAAISVPIGRREALDDELRELRDTGRPRRFGIGIMPTEGGFAEETRRLGIRSAVGVPIILDGRVWGITVASRWRPEPFDEDAEARIADFSDLVATALANSQVRSASRRLADEQDALRRVATLVAQGARPSQIFAVTAAEIRGLVGTDAAVLWRYEPSETATVIASQSDGPLGLPLGMELSVAGDSAMAAVLRTGKVAVEHRVDEGTGAVAAAARAAGLRSSVAAPVMVDGRLWGAVVASSRQAEVPDETARRTVDFTELLATAIANADSRRQLVASRTRVLNAADDARRRIVRDLHDGAQQRLVQTVVTLKLAKRAMGTDDWHDGESPEALLAEALEQAESANAELRDLSHGILPAALIRGGLRAGIDALVARARVPVTASVTDARLSPAIEASAYFVVAEALTNVAKHARATRASIQAWIDETTFFLEVRDDGVGGARGDGMGLVGLQDRIAALGGQLRLESPPGGGTRIAVELLI